MSWLSKYLRKIGLLAHWTPDDVLQAENEDRIRTIRKNSAEIEAVYSDQTQSNTKLRSSMQAVRRRAATFAQFEERIRNETSARSR